MAETWFHQLVQEGRVNQRVEMWRGRWCHIIAEANLQVQKYGGRSYHLSVMSNVPYYHNRSVVRVYTKWESHDGVFLDGLPAMQEQARRFAELWRPDSDNLDQAKQFALELAEITGVAYVVLDWNDKVGHRYQVAPYNANFGHRFVVYTSEDNYL